MPSILNSHHYAKLVIYATKAPNTAHDALSVSPNHVPVAQNKRRRLAPRMLAQQTACQAYNTLSSFQIGCMTLNLAPKETTAPRSHVSSTVGTACKPRLIVFHRICGIVLLLSAAGNVMFCNRADRCHVHLFAHPPRNRSVILPEGFSPFSFDSGGSNQHPNWDDWAAQAFSASWEAQISDEEQLAALVDEVERNGYGDDLATVDGGSLLAVVDRKMEHPRNHTAGHEEKDAARTRIVTSRGQMLALVLYTGCSCTYAMSKAEREGDRETWRWFSYVLNLLFAILGSRHSCDQLL